MMNGTSSGILHVDAVDSVEQWTGAVAIHVLPVPAPSPWLTLSSPGSATVAPPKRFVLASVMPFPAYGGGQLEGIQPQEHVAQHISWQTAHSTRTGHSVLVLLVLLVFLNAVGESAVCVEKLIRVVGSHNYRPAPLSCTGANGANSQ